MNYKIDENAVRLPNRRQNRSRLGVRYYYYTRSRVEVAASGVWLTVRPLSGSRAEVGSVRETLSCAGRPKVVLAQNHYRILLLLLLK